MNEKDLNYYYIGCKLIIEHYGIEKQKIQLIQELSELITALTKGDLQNIIEEIADVQVMLDQFSIKYPIYDKKIGFIQLEKVKRQLGRIKEEKEKQEIPK